MKLKDIKNIRELHTVLLLKEKRLKPFRNKAGQYLELLLQDSSGVVQAKKWDKAQETYEQIELGQPVVVKGIVEEYGGNYQIIIQDIEESLEDYCIEDFLPCIEEYDSVMKQFIDKVYEIQSKAYYNAPELEQVIKHVFHPTFLEKFCRAPAAVKYHHNYVGGLMEHTLNVVRITDNLTTIYPEADSMLALSGALLHDIGKIEEYSLLSGINQSEEGVLLGHIVTGVQILKNSIDRARRNGSMISEELEKLLQHIIVSHHYKGEWGSPKQPSILEAMLIHQADLIDAEAYKYLACEGEAGTCEWSPLLKRNVYIKKGFWEIPF